MTDITIERELYEPAKRFLHVSFLQRLREQSPLGDLQIYVADTSTTGGGEGGQWSRPDVAALVIGRGQFIPHWKAELHTFEVKTFAGLTETAVHEANAHGRFGHYTWVAFQSVGRASKEADTMFRRVKKLAVHLGVGVLHFADPEAPQTWQVENWPRHTGTDNSIADLFVRERFSEDTKFRISAYLASLGWIGQS